MPYAVHPLHVGLLLASHGHDGEVVAAGMLHDVVEDCGVALDEIARAFTPRVAALVAEVSEDKAGSWEQRKQHTIDSIARMSDGARAITAADKVHNLSDLLRLLGERGDEVWKLFRRGKGPTLDYYRRVADQLLRYDPGPLASELVTLLEQVERA